MLLMKEPSSTIGIVLLLAGIVFMTWRLNQTEPEKPLYRGENIVFSSPSSPQSSSSLWITSSSAAASSSSLSVSESSPDWIGNTVKPRNSSSKGSSSKSSSSSLQSSSSSSQAIHRRRSYLNCGNSTIPCFTSSSNSSQ